MRKSTELRIDDEDFPSNSNNSASSNVSSLTLPPTLPETNETARSSPSYQKTPTESRAVKNCGVCQKEGRAATIAWYNIWGKIAGALRLFLRRYRRGDLEGASMALWPSSWQRTAANNKWIMKAIRWVFNLQIMVCCS